jgi:hypothetical protein
VVGPAGPAVVLASPAEKSRLRVEVDRDALRQMTAENGHSATFLWTGQLHRWDGSSDDTRGDVVDVELSENEAAVWYP